MDDIAQVDIVGLGEELPVFLGIFMMAVVLATLVDQLIECRRRKRRHLDDRNDSGI